MKETKWSDYGESSLTIVSYLLGIEKERPAIPIEPSDFVRCIHLFDCLGYNKGHMKDIIDELATFYPIWEGIARQWHTLMKLYEEEKDCKTAPKLYDHLQKCRGKLS